MESRLQPGQNLLHYRLTAKIGEGGMGVVWQAHDMKLDRDVAIKLLPAELASNAKRRMRFEREARAVAALNHPNIVTLYSVEHVPAEGDAPDLSFLTMELVTGQPLAEAIGLNGLGYDRFLTLALPMAEALGRAHRAGIVHRDIKTANVVLNNDGAPKILDFGLARLDGDDEIEIDENDATVTELATRVGTVLGTPAYMAPEQARGHAADARSDIFSLGSVFYELLTGKRPFQRDSHEQSIQALLHDEPESVTSASRKVPREAESTLRKCLAKDPDQRFANGDELYDALSAVRERQRAAEGGNAWWRRPVVVLPLLIVALVAVGWVVRDRMKAAEGHRVRTELLPRIEQLLEKRAGFEPLMLALEAQRKLPGDPAVNKLVEAASVPVRVTSDPEGAAISIRSYMDPDAASGLRCRAPCDIRIPPSYLVFRAEAAGYETLEVAGAGFGTEIPLTLQPIGAAPEGMLRAPADRGGRPGEETFEFPAYWVDRYEVSNRQFQEFVSAGGYANPEYWLPYFTDEGKKLTLAQASVRFVDETGRPGPAGWQLSQYPEGEAELPVRGISAFEAEAYAAWRGRSLPTFHHWDRFAGRGYFAEILLTGNFDSDAVGEVGAPRALGPVGTYDTAGNVREWTSTDVGDRRYAMGGSYEDPPYTFSDDGANSPWDRLPTIGFRTVLYDTPPPPIAFEPFDATRFDFADVEVISDEVYGLVAERYAYAPRELDAQVERTDDSSELWVHETVSFTSVYGGTRVQAHLFLPTIAEPPYQTVLFRPGAAVNLLTRVDDFIVFLPRYVPRSGRAVVVPALYGTLGRQDPDGLTDRLMRQVQDMMRTVEYLKTRDDIDADRIAYVGLSAGGEYGPCYVANLPDVKAAVLMAAGYHDAHMLDEPRDQVPWNFSPRVTQPVLMINTDNDFTLPFELAQKPMFEQLGTPLADKKHVIVEGGHIPFDQTEVIRETLDWLDRYLGPVGSPSSGRPPR